MEKEKVQKIRFNGLDFILTDPDSNNSSVSTIKAFQKGECSYAHFYRDSGKVMRLGEQIATVDDIEFGEYIEVDVDLAVFVSGLIGNTWPL